MGGTSGPPVFGMRLFLIGVICELFLNDVIHINVYDILSLYV